MPNNKTTISYLERAVGIVDGMRWAIDRTAEPQDLDGFTALARATLPAAAALLEAVSASSASERVQAATEALVAIGWVSDRVMMAQDFDGAIVLVDTALSRAADALESAMDELQAAARPAALTDADSLRSRATQDSSLEDA